MEDAPVIKSQGLSRLMLSQQIIIHQEEAGEMSIGAVQGCLHFDLADLKEATNNFDNRSIRQGGCKLGEGGFGPVDRGRLKHTEVAIKESENSTKGKQSFGNTKPGGGGRGLPILLNVRLASQFLFLGGGGGCLLAVD